MNKPLIFFTDEEAIKTIDTRRILYLCIAVLFFIITEIGRNIYRPFIYNNKLNDWGIADSIGNLGGIVVQIFFTLAILNSTKNKGFNVIGFLVIGYIVYEILQPFLPRGVFDWKDVFGTLIGGILAGLIFWILSVFKNKVVYRF